MNYYNEFDTKAAAWLRELIAAGEIPDGDVDTRDIRQVKAHELTGYRQCHFFAGIGGWSWALRLAGWPAGRPVWTGSCPCQPFSAAGKRRGAKDSRHLWPEFRRLIGDCAPAIVFGEQVASADGRQWLAGVRADLERMGRAVGAADLCAASKGAPHIRQRLWFVSVPYAANDYGRRKFEAEGTRSGRARFAGSFTPGAVSDSGGYRCGQCTGPSVEVGTTNAGRSARGPGSGLPGELSSGPEGSDCVGDPTPLAACGAVAVVPEQPSVERAGAWSAFDILQFTDGKARRVEPGTFPLAHGVPGRVGLLRGYGNAIVPQVAAEFIAAFEETQNDTDF